MSEWAKAVTHPLGLVGFALFLIFSLLTARKRKELPGWKIAFLLTAAVLVLVSGLGLSIIESKKPSNKVVSPPSVKIDQQSEGDQSPPIAVVGGQVNVNSNNQAGPAPTEKKNAEEQKTAGQEPRSKKP